MVVTIRKTTEKDHSRAPRGPGLRPSILLLVTGRKSNQAGRGGGGSPSRDHVPNASATRVYTGVRPRTGGSVGRSMLASRSVHVASARTPRDEIASRKWFMALSVGASGIVLGVIRHFTGRLGSSIATHALFNVTAIVALAFVGTR